MIEEGNEWMVHQRTKVHRRLASKTKMCGSVHTPTVPKTNVTGEISSEARMKNT